MKRHRQHWLMASLLITLLILAGCSPGLSEEPSGEEVAAGETEKVPAVEEPLVEEPMMEEPAADEPESEESEAEVPVPEVPVAEPPAPEPQPEPAPEVPAPEVPAPEPPAPEPQPEPAPKPEAALSGSLVNGVREIEVVAYQFDFGPDPIRVQQGETVRLLLTTDDVAHGIGLSQFGISVRITAGETTEVTFVADTAGEFTFVCNVPCGAGHSSMTGQLIVI